MILVKLMGGLGNQMFQYAAACSLSHKLRTELMLDITWFYQNFHTDTTPRKYELDCFLLDDKVRKINSQIKKKIVTSLYRHYEEPSFNYDPEFQKISNNTYLVGYFQSEEYFIQSVNSVVESFSWKNKLSYENELLYNNIKQDPSSTSLHIRRGDYIKNIATAKHHGVINYEYYERAVKLISRQINKPSLYIFSDDPDWCIKNIQFSNPTVFVSHNINGSDDMKLMAACRNNIIANSSFSWWGAWLNKNPDKIVLTPKNWFADGSINTSNIIPKKWQKI